MTALPAGRRRRLSVMMTILLSLSFSACLVCWILYFPFHPSLILRVVPPEATLVSMHLRPADRVDAMLKSAPAAVVLAAANVPADEAKAILDDPGVRSLIHRLGDTAATLAFTPGVGVHGNPKLLLGAWVGGVTTHAIRGGWMDLAFEGFTVHRLGRDRIWSGFFPELPEGLRYLSFGVYEGVLAGCASSDPLAAMELIYRLKQHGSLPEWTLPLLAPQKGGEGFSTVDTFRASLHLPDGTQTLWSGGFNLQTNGAVDGRLVLEAAEDLTGRMASLLKTGGDRLVSLCPLPEKMPAILSAITVDRGLATVELLPPGNRERMLLSTVAGFAAPGGGICVWGAGGGYSGHIMRLKVPCAGFAMQVPHETRPEGVAATLTDTLNALYGVGLMAMPDRKNAEIYTFLSVKDKGGFAILNPDERPALAVRDGWLIGMSSVDVLRRLLDEIPSGAVGTALSEKTDSVWLYGQASLPAVSEVAVTALAGYALMRLMQTGTAERHDTPLVKRVLQALQTLGSVSVGAGYDQNGRFIIKWMADGGNVNAYE